MVWICPVLVLLYFHDNVVAGGAARAHIHGDKAYLSLPWLIAVRVSPSEATLPYISPQPIYILLCLSVLRTSMWNGEKITLQFGGKKWLVLVSPTLNRSVTVSEVPVKILYEFWPCIVGIVPYSHSIIKSLMPLLTAQISKKNYAGRIWSCFEKSKQSRAK